MCCVRCIRGIRGVDMIAMLRGALGFPLATMAASLGAGRCVSVFGAANFDLSVASC